MVHLAESTVESAALAWLEAIGWRIAHGPDIAPGMPAADFFGNLFPADELKLELSQLEN